MVRLFIGSTVTVLLESTTPLAPWIGLAAAAVAGLVYSILHAFASINLKAIKRYLVLRSTFFPVG